MILGLGLGLGFAPGVKVFSPADLAGLLAYYDADLGVVGSAWADSSKTGDANKNLTATGSPVHTSDDATLNNQGSWTYSAGTTQKHQSGVWSVLFAQPCTVWYVGTAPISGTQTGVDNLSSSFQITTSGSSLDVYAGAIFNTHLAPASPAVIVAELDGAGVCNVYINALSVSATGNAGTNGGTGLTVGNASAGAFGVGGPIANVGLYSGISSANRIALIKYLGARYGIAIGP